MGDELRTAGNVNVVPQRNDPGLSTPVHISIEVYPPPHGKLTPTNFA